MESNYRDGPTGHKNSSWSPAIIFKQYSKHSARPVYFHYKLTQKQPTPGQTNLLSYGHISI